MGANQINQLKGNVLYCPFLYVQYGGLIYFGLHLYPSISVFSLDVLISTFRCRELLQIFRTRKSGAFSKDFRNDEKRVERKEWKKEDEQRVRMWKKGKKKGSDK